MTVIPFQSLRITMLRRICRHCIYRNFSRSSLWRNELQKQPPEKHSSEEAVMKMDGVPKEWEKKILVYSGSYKSYEDIPPRVSSDTLGKAKSVMRIRIANVMMVGILLLCFYFSYKAKQMAKGGDSIVKRVLENNEKVIAEGKAEAAAKAKAEPGAKVH